MKQKIVEVFENGTETRIYIREGNTLHVIPLGSKDFNLEGGAKKFIDLLKELKSDEDKGTLRVSPTFVTAKESIAYPRKKRAEDRNRLRQILESAIEELDEEDSKEEDDRPLSPRSWA